MIMQEDFSFTEGREYIKVNFKEVYEVEPGYKLFDVYLIGVPPILVGAEDAHVIFTYMKHCCGTFVLKLEGKIEEPDRLKRIGPKGGEQIRIMEVDIVSKKKSLLSLLRSETLAG